MQCLVSLVSLSKHLLCFGQSEVRTDFASMHERSAIAGCVMGGKHSEPSCHPCARALVACQRSLVQAQDTCLPQVCLTYWMSSHQEASSCLGPSSSTPQRRLWPGQTAKQDWCLLRHGLFLVCREPARKRLWYAQTFTLLQFPVVLRAPLYQIPPSCCRLESLTHNKLSVHAALHNP